MKKTILMSLLVMFVVLHSFVCFANDEIEPDTLSQEELVEAYNNLKTKYDMALEKYSEELLNNSRNGSATNVDDIINNLSQFSTTEIQLIFSEAQDELDSRADEAKEQKTVADNGDWEVKHYVDEFNEPTETTYLTYNSVFEGTFSNIATTNSPLCVKILVDDRIAFILYEYKNNQVTSYSQQEYLMVFRDSSGNKTQAKAFMYKNGDRICVAPADQEAVLDVLKSQGEIKVYLEESGKTIDSYTFTIPNASGFANAYSSMSN